MSSVVEANKLGGIDIPSLVIGMTLILPLWYFDRVRMKRLLGALVKSVRLSSDPKAESLTPQEHTIVQQLCSDDSGSKSSGGAGGCPFLAMQFKKNADSKKKKNNHNHNSNSNSNTENKTKAKVPARPPAPATLDTVEEMASHYGLEEHPEGTLFFRRTYASQESLTVPRKTLGERKTEEVERECCTAIQFVLPKGCVSRLHTLQSDEMWHYYGGVACVVVEVCTKNTCECGLRAQLPSKHTGPVIVTTRVCREWPQYVVHKGHVFGAYAHDIAPPQELKKSNIKQSRSFSWMGCTVHPGFNFDDFHLYDSEANLQLSTQLKNTSRATRSCPDCEGTTTKRCNCQYQKFLWGADAEQLVRNMDV